LNVATDYFKTNNKYLKNWEDLQNQLKNDEFLRENITSFMITENN
jgi:hypothetical protein